MRQKRQPVVRLKGGDPFIFGRGGEEIIALIENNIDYEIVPGISSCYSAAEYCGIPVTHRGVATSFHVITGHEKVGMKRLITAHLQNSAEHLFSYGAFRLPKYKQ